METLESRVLRLSSQKISQIQGNTTLGISLVIERRRYERCIKRFILLVVITGEEEQEQVQFFFSASGFVAFFRAHCGTQRLILILNGVNKWSYARLPKQINDNNLSELQVEWGLLEILKSKVSFKLIDYFDYADCGLLLGYS